MSVLDLNRGDRAPTSPFIQEFYSCLVVTLYDFNLFSSYTYWAGHWDNFVAHRDGPLAVGMCGFHLDPRRTVRMASGG